MSFCWIFLAKIFSGFPKLVPQAGWGAPPGSLRRVVPLPPPENSGAVKFTFVVLSLAYDNFGEAGAPATIPATVRNPA
jgi:hypothetical protein